MKSFLLLLVFSFYTGVSAQFAVSGKLVNEKEQPIEYAEASITNVNDTTNIKTTLTDKAGKFSLPVMKGSYSLSVVYLGQELVQKNLSVTKNTHLGVIKVSLMNQIGKVTVTAKKPLIEQKIDRFVFNVENSIASRGMSGMEALQNTPFVRVEESRGISIVGKSGVSVMVNGRMLHLSGDTLTTYLRSLRSDDIARIEIITTPPAKYEAQGNSGIINIVLKKNTKKGWSGSVSGTYRRNQLNGFRGNAVLNYQSTSSRLNSSLKVSQYDEKYLIPGITRDFLGKNQTIHEDENQKQTNYGTGLNYSLDYKLSKQSNIGFIYDYSVYKTNIYTDNKSIYTSENKIDSVLNTHQKQPRELRPLHTLNTYYELKLDSLGKKLSLTGNYLKYPSNLSSDFNTRNLNTEKEYPVRNSSKTDDKIYSGQADLTLPYPKIYVETGVKYAFFDDQSAVKYEVKNPENHDEGYHIQPGKSNVFDYKEQNYAVYLSVKRALGKKWSVKAGLRYEYSVVNGKSEPEKGESIQEKDKPAYDDEVHQKYGKFFPTLYVNYTPSENHTFSLNYSRRVNRPGFSALDPFRWYSNAYSYFAGNHYLQPSYNYNVEFSYLYKSKLSLSLYNQYEHEGYMKVLHLTEGIQSNVYNNAYNSNTAGVKASYYDTLLKIWELSANANVWYSHTTPILPEVAGIEQYAFYYDISNTLCLNRKKTLFLMLNFLWVSPYIDGNTHIESRYQFIPGIKLSLFDKKLQVNMVGTDVFKTLKNKGYNAYTEYRSEFNGYNDVRGVRLSVTWSFGNKKVKGVKKNIQFKESKRAN